MLFDGGWDINRPVNNYCPPAISVLLGYIDFVKHWLALGASLNASSPSGHTVMQRAVSYAPLEVIKLLVADGATIKGTNLLAYAASAYTQAQATSSSQTPQSEDRQETIHYLLDQGAPIDARYSATMKPNMHTGDGIMYGTMTALYFAIARNRVGLVQLLLDRGAQIELQSRSSWKTRGR